MSFCIQCGRHTNYPDLEGRCKNCTSIEKEVVLLDSLDGSEFEQVCKRVLEKLDYERVENIQDTSDEGRDLIVHQKNGEKIVVECKHHPKSSIGRPIVQKLHSATISIDAKKAMLMTTGLFSQAALEYARRIQDIEIEMIDRTKLFDLADRAGIRLATAQTSSPVTTYYASDKEILAKKVLNLLNPISISSPNKLEQLLNVVPKRLKLNPVYLIHFNLHQDFETTVGNICSMHRDDIALLINANNGEPVSDDDTKFIINNTRIDTGQIPKFSFPIERPDFTLGLSSVKNQAKKIIIQKYARNVSYYGKNNVRYVKTCRPNQSNIFITDIKQTYYPEWETTIKILEKEYQTSFLENKLSILKTHFDLDYCKECGKKIEKNILICNNCGNVVHPPKRFNSHSHICVECGKTMCKQCTYWKRKWLILKQKLCKECGLSTRAKMYSFNNS